MPSVLHGESLFQGLKTTYSRFAGPLSSASLIGGFVFDAVTLKRVDSFWEMFWVVAHLAIVAGCILVLNRGTIGGAARQELGKAEFWCVNGLQFFFGGLLSTFLVLNFRSGSLWVSWPFLAILAAAFVANERLKGQYARFYFQLSLFFLSLYCTVILILPVIVHSAGRASFLASSLITLAVTYGFLRVVKAAGGGRIDIGRRSLVGMIAGIFLVIQALYFLNVIPPVPLSLRDAGVYHGVQRTADGNYLVQAERGDGLGFFRLAETFHSRAGAAVFAYSAVFSPASLNTTIVHRWQFYDPARHRWADMGRVELPVRGGRGEGYRTYSVKTGVIPGAWRVDVETPSGALLGRLRFNVMLEPEDPPIVTEVKN